MKLMCMPLHLWNHMFTWLVDIYYLYTLLQWRVHHSVKEIFPALLGSIYGNYLLSTTKK